MQAKRGVQSVMILDMLKDSSLQWRNINVSLVISVDILPGFTSSDDTFYLQVRIQCVQAEFKFPKTSHLITNLAYKLKPPHKRNQYLRARLDTCTDVNIIQVGL